MSAVFGHIEASGGLRDPSSAMHIYDRTYYDYINGGAIRSAEHVLPAVQQHFDIRSVLDFGAGQGAWLSVWRRLGVKDVMGIDGAYVERSALLVRREEFLAADLGQEIRHGRTFDLVQSLEVAEHLPASRADVFVDNLVAHGSLVLFSAAAPGQGGEHHVNERPYAYWRDMFAARGFLMLDVIRAAVASNRAVERWYRYNSFIFIAEARFGSLPPELRLLQAPVSGAVEDVSPLAYRVRKALIKPLPVAAATTLATLKKHWYTRRGLTVRHG